MVRDSFQLRGDAAAIYEEQKVAAIFKPLAEATLDVVTISLDDSVLDVACGTGIVARMVRERYAGMARIAGVDLNEGMIETARALTRDFVDPIEWRVADAASMPFENGSFSVVLCQQGIQFFPNEKAALTEMRRVLSNGGRLVLSVWAGASDFFRALADALDRHVDGHVATQSLAPFSYDAEERLPALLSEAGFHDINVRVVSVDRMISSPEQDIPKEIMGSPIGPAVAERGDAVMRSIVDDVILHCANHRRGGRLVIPQSAHVITAVAA